VWNLSTNYSPTVLWGLVISQSPLSRTIRFENNFSSVVARTFYCDQRRHCFKPSHSYDMRRWKLDQSAFKTCPTSAETANLASRPYIFINLGSRHNRPPVIVSHTTERGRARHVNVRSLMTSLRHLAYILVQITNPGPHLVVQPPVVHHMDETETQNRKALEGRRRALGQDHPDTLTTVLRLVKVLVQRQISRLLLRCIARRSQTS
jgi:hypothetical protein